MRKYSYRKNASNFFGALALSALAGFFAFSGFSGRQNSREINHKVSANPELVSRPAPPDFGELPLSFEANAGQTDGQVKFVSRGHGYALFLTGAETVLSLRKNDRQTPLAVLRMRLGGANRTPKVAGENELAGKSNYFVGGNRNNWKTDVPNFSRVRYEEVYPGIDQVFYGNERELEYDFVVAPQTDYKQIAVNFAGADNLVVDPTGDLILSIGGERIRQQKPVAYQEIDGEKRYVAANYEMRSAQKIGFTLGDYDRTQPLVIDPVLVYSTYLGGNGSDSGRSIAIDHEKNVYVTGSTLSTNFPALNPAQATNAGVSDVFVTKINQAGNAIVYSTYIGGNVGDIGYGIDVDAAGNAYVTGVTGGTTGANTFPTTENAFDRVFNAPDESFLFKLNQSGDALVYSTYTGAAIGFEVKVNRASGEAYVAGSAGATLPTTPGAFRTACQPTPCASNSFVTKFNPTGSALVYSTYIGPGPANDLAIDAGGNAYVTGSTISNFFPVTPGAAQPNCVGCNVSRSDAFVTKLNQNGSALIYSTYLGGSVDEVGTGIAVDASGNAYVTGRTESSNAVSVPFPTTPGAFQTVSQGVPDAFVTKLNPNGTAFVYSTYLGGNVRDEAFGIAVDGSGSAHVTGNTRSNNFPLVQPISSTGGVGYVFFSTLNPAGSGLIFSTYFGGGEGNELVADTAGAIYIVGTTFGNVPTMNPIQPNPGSPSDAFVAKIQVQSVQTRRAQFDFDGDGRADIAVFRPSDGVWYLQQSAAGFTGIAFGQMGDKIVPADYDGDGKSDVAVFRPSNGVWYLKRSTQGFTGIAFGTNGDIPLPGDYDGDGRADLSVFRPSNGVWYIQGSQSGFIGVRFGANGDVPVAADYDGDGKTDIAVFRPSNGVWYLQRSGLGFTGVAFGAGGDKPTPADYDGDGKADIAVFRPSNGVWYLQQSTAGFNGVAFGVSDDAPVPADYDGDGRADIAVFRSSNGVWYLQRSTQGFAGIAFGANGDTPTPNAFIP